MHNFNKEPINTYSHKAEIINNNEDHSNEKQTELLFVREKNILLLKEIGELKIKKSKLEAGTYILITLY